MFSRKATEELISKRLQVEKKSEIIFFFFFFNAVRKKTFREKKITMEM